MRLDKYGNPIFNESDIFNALYRGHELSSDMFVDISDQITSLEEASNLKFWFPLDSYDIPVSEYDAAMQADWKMPDEYKQMDIEAFLVSQCPKENYQRLIEELQEFRERNMLDLLRWMKYFVDTCTENNVVWGVGRGSSVASYVLYLIGVHSIDPIRYNLDWHEFLR
jgi:DNA polymerase III alpha subunit